MHKQILTCIMCAASNISSRFGGCLIKLKTCFNQVTLINMLLFTCWMGFKLIDRHGFVLYFELKTTFEEYGVELRYYSLGSKW